MTVENERVIVFNTVIHGVVGMLGLGLFVTAKEIFLSLPQGSPFAGCFAILASVGLLILFGSVVSLRHT